MDFDGFYEGRVVEAELEAIRLRKTDTGKVMFWLWPPFGPSDERERQLTAPKPTLASLQNAYGNMAQFQNAMIQQALMNTNMASRQNQYAAHYGSLFGGLGIL